MFHSLYTVSLGACHVISVLISANRGKTQLKGSGKAVNVYHENKFSTCANFASIFFRVNMWDL